MERNFWEMLSNRQSEVNSLLSVGLDPEIERIPECFKSETNTTSTIFKFNFDRIQKTAAAVSCFKLNVGFYLRHGSAGIAALEKTVSFIKEFNPNIPIILDGKWGDTPSSNFPYLWSAFQHLGVDAITIHHYPGRSALKPFLDQEDKGIFVICRMSNEDAGEIQDLLVPTPGDGLHVPLYQHVADCVATAWNKKHNCGLVVGATCPDEMKIVRRTIGDKMTILAPGVGAQGGNVEKVVRAGITSNGRGLIINSSGSITFADDPSQAALELRDESNQHRQPDRRKGL